MNEQSEPPYLESTSIAMSCKSQCGITGYQRLHTPLLNSLFIMDLSICSASSICLTRGFTSLFASFVTIELLH